MNDISIPGVSMSYKDFKYYINQYQPAFHNRYQITIPYDCWREEQIYGSKDLTDTFNEFDFTSPEDVLSTMKFYAERHSLILEQFFKKGDKTGLPITQGLNNRAFAFYLFFSMPGHEFYGMQPKDMQKNRWYKKNIELEINKIKKGKLKPTVAILEKLLTIAHTNPNLDGARIRRDLDELKKS